MSPLYPGRECETVMSLSEGSPPAVAVCLSAPLLSHHLVVLDEGKEGRKEEKRTSVHPVSLCAESEKKRGELVTI